MKDCCAHNHYSGGEPFDAVRFFRTLTENNVLCQQNGFRFAVVSDIDGFGEALDTMQESRPLVALSDTSAGQVFITGAPVTRRVKTVFLFMPHSINGDIMTQRVGCFNVMREISRQFMSVILRIKTKLKLNGVQFSDAVAFEEMEQMFFSGGACAYFQFSMDIPTDLTLKSEQWLSDPMQRIWK